MTEYEIKTVLQKLELSDAWIKIPRKLVRDNTDIHEQINVNEYHYLIPTLIGLESGHNKFIDMGNISIDYIKNIFIQSGDKVQLFKNIKNSIIALEKLGIINIISPSIDKIKNTTTITYEINYDCILYDTFVQLTFKEYFTIFNRKDYVTKEKIGVVLLLLHIKSHIFSGKDFKIRLYINSYQEIRKSIGYGHNNTIAKYAQIGKELKLFDYEQIGCRYVQTVKHYLSTLWFLSTNNESERYDIVGEGICKSIKQGDDNNYQCHFNEHIIRDYDKLLQSKKNKIKAHIKHGNTSKVNELQKELDSLSKSNEVYNDNDNIYDEMVEEKSEMELEYEREQMKNRI